jgi:hypothetical protein
MSNWTRFRDTIVASATSALIDRLFGRVVAPKKGKDEVTEINPAPPPTPEVVAPAPTFPDINQPEDAARHLRFGASTGLLIKPAERGGIVVLLPGEYGKAKIVRLEGDRGVLELTSDGFANPHRGLDREHWRNRGANPAQLQDRKTRLGRVRKGILGSVKNTFLVVDGYRVKVPRRLTERNE